MNEINLAFQRELNRQLSMACEMAFIGPRLKQTTTELGIDAELRQMFKLGNRETEK